MSNILQVILIIVVIGTLALIGPWCFAHFPVISWVVAIIAVVGGGLTITGVLPTLYRKITGKK